MRKDLFKFLPGLLFVIGLLHNAMADTTSNGGCPAGWTVDDNYLCVPPVSVCPTSTNPEIKWQVNEDGCFYIVPCTGTVGVGGVVTGCGLPQYEYSCVSPEFAYMSDGSNYYEGANCFLAHPQCAAGYAYEGPDLDNGSIIGNCQPSAYVPPAPTPIRTITPINPNPKPTGGPIPVGPIHVIR